MASAPSNDQEDEKQRAQQRFHRLHAENLVEGHLQQGAGQGLAELWNNCLVESLRNAQSSQRVPKYFSGHPPKREAIEEIDAAGLSCASSGAQKDKTVRLLCSDMLNLCMALKPRVCEPATAEDPNLTQQHVRNFFDGASDEALDASLQDLEKLIEVMLSEGCEELAASPAKLRAVLIIMLHPLLFEAMPGSGYDEQVKKLMQLIGQLHAHSSAREVLSKWFAAMPCSFLEEALGNLRQYLTISVVLVQDQLVGNNMAAALKLAREEGFSSETRNLLRLADLYWRANEIRRQRARSWKTRWQAERMRQQGELLDADLSAFIELNQFHNDAINECEGMLKHDLREVLEMRSRGQYFAALEDSKRYDFGIVEFPFVLTPVCKVRMLSIESVLMQREEIRNAMAMQLIAGRISANPWLVLKVRRTSVIADALQQLAALGPSNFKKPLKVVFDGEEGVDEGGVQKEFFQILIEEMYKEDYGMFERGDTENFWFNKNSFEVGLQFELFGIVLGLAIYNQVILDVRFPMAVYKKLMGGSHAKLDLSDLLDFQPALARGLIQLLEHPDQSSFESAFGSLSFVVEYECFGSRAEAELKEGGKDIPVTWDNRAEYVQCYCDWIFNSSVQGQYSSFRKGFDQCISDTLFRQLFRPDELELVICGQLELDFDALEKVSQYQDGYDADKQAVKWFWEVVKALDPPDQRKFLMFCTGCDRAPVGGLGKLPFVISRAGPDSNMLPSVHTCFNHILLPEYASKEKLERLLGIAIENCTGFGLL